MQLWRQGHFVERLTFDDNLTLFFNGHHELVLWVAVLTHLTTGRRARHRP
ncbi:hypothetical protein [Williamsia sp. 1135]|nr:hypothetical protein [Williamsia sp. 1135]